MVHRAILSLRAEVEPRDRRNHSRMPLLSGLSLVLLLGCRGADTASGGPATWTSADSARVGALIAPLVAAHEFMGAVVLVRHGQVVYAQGAGMADVAANRPFTPATSADGGSIAKTFTAAMVWTLVHQGRIAIDTPVTAYVPEFPHAETTVRQLIAHTNGLPPYYEQFDPHFGPKDVRTTTGLLDVVGRAMPRPRFTPGTRFEYSNLGFDAAALVVERVTGQSIGEVFRRQFFGPLVMDSAFARPGRFADFPGPRTLGHRWADTAWVVLDVYDNEAFVGGSNVYLSAIDLSRWAAAHAAGTALSAAVERLGRERPIIDGKPSPINGLSWYCDETGLRCQYTGDNNAFHTLAYWDRTRDEAVAMVSNSNLAPWTLISLQRALVSTLAGREATPAPRPSFVMVDERQRVSLVGQYASTKHDTISVSNTSEGMRLRIGGSLEFDLFQVAPDVFYVPGSDYFVGFTDDSGQRRMHVRSMFTDFVASRVP